MTRMRNVMALLSLLALLAAACGGGTTTTTQAAPVTTAAPDTSAQEAAQAAQEAAEAAQETAEAALADAQAELDAAAAALAEAEAEAEAGDEASQAALEEARAEAEAAAAAAAEAEAEAAAAAAAAAEAEAAVAAAAAGPGAGVSVTIARANWSTGYMQAAIYAALLEELGYTVSDPSDLELAPSNAFVAMANGEFDFWANSWFPNHNQFLAGAMPDGSLVSDHVTTLGFEMRTGGLQGLLTNKSLVDEHGIRTLDQIVNDPALFAIYDAGDSSPDDGVIQILGCPDGWGCHVNINSWIENAGWANVEQVEVGSYDALIADAISRDASGAPYIVYTWAPSAYVGDLRAGDNAIWLSTSDESVSPTQVAGPAVLGAGQCSSDPCNLGWDAADIRVTANSDFLAANPAAARLFELVTINPVDVALQNVTYSLGANTEADVRSHAAEWIADNRATVDVWLAVAQVPPGDTPGAGVSVNAARANWSTGYMQAAIYAALLEELGYTVSDPSDLELAPSNAFVAMANGEFDFWANSWFPNHNQFLAGAMPDGSLVSDHVTTLGFEMRTGGLQGLLTNKSLVDEHGIRTLDQIVNDPALFAIYDAGDSSPDDGVIQILGCPDGWGCHVNINSWIENAGWANVEQVEVGSYDALIADAISRDASGAPYIVYTWAPSAYVGDLRAGDNAIWLSTSDESVSPTQVAGPAVLGAGQCSSDPCNLGWDAADIRVTANSDFLAANPAAARLFELVTINPVDVALQNVTYSLGANTEADVRSHAAEWIADNRELVDSWLLAARIAG